MPRTPLYPNMPKVLGSVNCAQATIGAIVVIKKMPFTRKPTPTSPNTIETSQNHLRRVNTEISV